MAEGGRGFCLSTPTCAIGHNRHSTEETGFVGLSHYLSGMAGRDEVIYTVENGG